MASNYFYETNKCEIATDEQVGIFADVQKCEMEEQLDEQMLRVEDQLPSFSTVVDRDCISDGEDVSVANKKRKKMTFHRSLSLSDLKYGRNSRIFTTTYTSKRHLSKEDDDEEEYLDSQIFEDKSSCCSCVTKGGLNKFNRQQKLTLICLALINFGAYLSMSVIAPFFPIEGEKKGMSLSTIGYVFSSYALVMFCISPVIGQTITFVGVKFTFIAGVFLAAGSNILFGALNFIDDSTLFTVFCFVLRSTEALGAAAYVTASCTIVAEIFPDDIGAVIGIMETFVGLGMTVGPAVGSGLYFLGGFEVPFYTLGSLLMITIPICMVVLPDPQPKEQIDKTSPVSILQLISLPPIIISSLVIMVLCGIWGFLDPTLEPHLREFGTTPESIGLLFLLISATYGITCPIIGKVSDKWGYETPLMASGLIITAFCLLMMGPDVILPFLPRNLWLNITALTLMGISIGMGLIPTYQTMLNAAYDRGFEENTMTFGLVSSIFSSASSLGEFIGPALGGFLYENFSYDHASTSIGLFSFCVAAILLLYKMFYVGINRRKKVLPRSLTSTPTSKMSDSGIEDSTATEDSNERTPLL